MQIDVKCSKSYFKTLLPQEAGDFGNNIEKETQTTPKKYAHYIFTENICSVCSPMQVKVSYKNVLIMQNNDSNFVTLKVA